MRGFDRLLDNLRARRLTWLDSMRFMLRVEVRDVSADYAVIGEPVRAETTPAEPLAWSDPGRAWSATPRHTAPWSTRPLTREASDPGAS